MNFTWDQNTIRWYQEANEYTGFYKNVAALIAPSLQGYATFCDMGCGLGLIDLELSTCIDRITCVDINEQVIQALQKSIREREINNIDTRAMDISYLEGSWDVIHLSFFGSRSLVKYLPRCKKLIAVVTKTDYPAFYPVKYKKTTRSTVADVEQILTDLRIPYTLRDVSLEFGQPLRSMEEARSFVRAEASKISEEDLNNFLSERLLETGQEKYPFYIPNLKTFGIFEIEGYLK